MVQCEAGFWNAAQFRRLTGDSIVNIFLGGNVITAGLSCKDPENEHESFDFL
jgi:hypothetical protein